LLKQGNFSFNLFSLFISSDFTSCDSHFRHFLNYLCIMCISQKLKITTPANENQAEFWQPSELEIGDY